MRYVYSLLFLLLSLPSFAQKVAKYVSGTAGRDDYQEICFWSDKRIIFKSGNGAGQNIGYYGTAIHANERVFIIMMPGNQMARVTVNDNGKLYIAGLSTNYFKVFSWRYGGGRVNKGICLSCTLNAREALKMIKRVYL